MDRLCDSTQPNSLADLARKHTHKKIYLVEIKENDIGKILGIKSYPEDRNEKDIRTYRYIGQDKNNLNCDSSKLIRVSSKLVCKDTTLKCDGQPVFTMYVDNNSRIPSAEILWDYISINTKIEPNTKRNKLIIKNNTNKDELGRDEPDGRYLHLVWERDVDSPPQITETLRFQAEDSRKTRGIGNGDNWRHICVEVSRLLDDKPKEYIGRFTHDIYAPAYSNGVTSRTKIYKVIRSDKIELWRSWIDTKTGDFKNEPIGSLSKDKW